MIRKKSQMEIMGLVVIVILITVAVLFVLVFIVRQSPSDIKEEYYHSQLASNTLNALIRTTTLDCKGHDMTSLSKDCVENLGYKTSQICCSDGLSCLDEMRSCAYLNSSVNQILSKSLASFNKKYQFNIIDSNNREVIPQIGECLGERESSNPQPLATDTGMMEIILYICEDI